MEKKANSLTAEDHLNNILKLIAIDDWDEVVMGYILSYVKIHGLDIPFNRCQVFSEWQITDEDKATIRHLLGK